AVAPPSRGSVVTSTPSRASAAWAQTSSSSSLAACRASVAADAPVPTPEPTTRRPPRSPAWYACTTRSGAPVSRACRAAQRSALSELGEPSTPTTMLATTRLLHGEQRREADVVDVPGQLLGVDAGDAVDLLDAADDPRDRAAQARVTGERDLAEVDRDRDAELVELREHRLDGVADLLVAAGQGQQHVVTRDDPGHDRAVEHHQPRHVVARHEVGGVAQR